MKILLTGATGFVAKGVLAKLNKYKIRLTSKSKIPYNFDDFFQKKISSTTDFSDCLKNIDLVIHTAARVHQMRDKSKDPLIDFMEINCYGTLNLAMQAAEAGVKRFIFISSIKVNGEKTISGMPFRHDDIVNTNDPYAVSKYKAEVGLLEIAKNYDMEVVIIRPPLVYGPGVKGNFKSLMNLSKKNIPLPLGSIKNKRSFVALENLVDLILICIDHPNAANKIFLISDDSDISTPRLIKLISNAFGSKVWLININTKLLKLFAKLIGKESIVNRLCDDFEIDIKHTKDTLSWTPPISMEQGITLCVDDIKDNC